MGKYLKKFETHSEYNTYITGSDKVLPNVSYCEDNNDVHYNPWTDPRVIAKFNVSDTSSATNIMHSSATSTFSEIEIDGVVQPSVVSSYTFDTTGEHVVKYTLADPTTIGQSAFETCTGLTNITIPNSVSSIGNYAFFNCSGLTTITIPNSVTSIGESAFQFCSYLTNITIPNGVTSIDNQAFFYCTSITSITIPDSVTTIGYRPFQGCTSLMNIKVDSGNSVYDSRNNCNAIIETATNTLIQGCQNTVIPNSVTTIGNGAFCDFTNLTSIGGIDSGASIEIPDSVTSITQMAFFGCTGLTSVEIPNSVTTIGNQTFSNCRGLTSIVIGAGITSLGDNIFFGCMKLESITSLATTAPTASTQTFNEMKSSGTLYVPIGSTGYDVWMGSSYLGKRYWTWTKVEQ